MSLWLSSLFNIYLVLQFTLSQLLPTKVTNVFHISICMNFSRLYFKKKVTPLQRKCAWISSLALFLHLVKRFVILHWRGQWRQQSASLGMLLLLYKQNIKRFDSHRLSQLALFRLEFSLCEKSVVWEVKSQYSQPAAPRRECPLYEWGLGGKRAPALSVVPAVSSFLQHCYRDQSYWYPDTPRMKMQP